MIQEGQNERPRQLKLAGVFLRGALFSRRSRWLQASRRPQITSTRALFGSSMPTARCSTSNALATAGRPRYSTYPYGRCPAARRA